MATFSKCAKCHCRHHKKAECVEIPPYGEYRLSQNAVAGLIDIVGDSALSRYFIFTLQPLFLSITRRLASPYSYNSEPSPENIVKIRASIKALEKASKQLNGLDRETWAQLAANLYPGEIIPEDLRQPEVFGCLDGLTDALKATLPLPKKRGRPIEKIPHYIAEILIGLWERFFDERPSSSPGGKIELIALLVAQEVGYLKARFKEELQETLASEQYDQRTQPYHSGFQQKLAEIRAENLARAEKLFPKSSPAIPA